MWSLRSSRSRRAGYVEGRNVAIDHIAGPQASTIGCRCLHPIWSTASGRDRSRRSHCGPGGEAGHGEDSDSLRDRRRPGRGLGLFTSSADRAAMLTGVSFLINVLAKQLEVLRELIPKAKPIGARWRTRDKSLTPRRIRMEIETVARTLGLKLLTSMPEPPRHRRSLFDPGAKAGRRSARH